MVFEKWLSQGPSIEAEHPIYLAVLDMMDYWLPKDIFFTRDQCSWIISDVLTLPPGSWPVNPQGSTYINDPLCQKSHSHHAPFETPCQITGELLTRLKSTREAGEALTDEILSGLTNYDQLSRPAKRALNYISGWRRRKQSYPEWKKYNGNSSNQSNIPTHLDKVCVLC